eukprot:TRINITY_DN9040_c0_g1_i1.p1 TRINITY_DN9040_c0_g1~~TRINITY_DN9040_c0_g1_i1.p1  ORF type:complete len:217 (-),score=62.24 TRINITY_DN9040_c0_g1_i1:157-807(-)
MSDSKSDSATVSADALSRVFRVRKTVHEMLIARGYVVSQDELKMSLEDFKKQFGDTIKRSQLTILASKKDDPTASDQIFVFFAEEPNLGVKPIRGLLEKMDAQKAQRAIIIVQNSVTPFAKQALQSLSARVMIEQFTESELLVNITQHILVPKHILLNEEEKNGLLRKYKLKPTQLPRIQVADPVAKFLGLQKGQVVKIVRTSETAGKYVTYRLVV